MWSSANRHTARLMNRGAQRFKIRTATSREEVDQLYAQLKDIGAVIVSKPKLYPEYSPYYYAVFFKDIEGIKYEIVYDKPDGVRL